MSKTVIIWFNFSLAESSDTPYLSSGFTLRSGDIVDCVVNAGSAKGCACGCIRFREIDTVNNRETFQKLENILMSSKVTLVPKCYTILRQTIKELYTQIFDFNSNNVAVKLAKNEQFDHLKIVQKFYAKLDKAFPVTIKINESEVGVKITRSVPFVNVSDSQICEFNTLVKQGVKPEGVGHALL